MTRGGLFGERKIEALSEAKPGEDDPNLLAVGAVSVLDRDDGGERKIHKDAEREVNKGKERS